MGNGAYHDQKPSWKPQYGPNAAVTQATYPESSGKAVASSAVTRASGMDHSRGRHRNPISANSGPPALTASCVQPARRTSRHVATSHRVACDGIERESGIKGLGVRSDHVRLDGAHREGGQNVWAYSHTVTA